MAVYLRMKQGANSLGLNTMDSATQIRSSFYGIIAYEIQVGSEQYDIDVRSPGLTGIPFTISISLTGIVVNDSLLVVEFIRKRITGNTLEKSGGPRNP
ncbi:MAG: hypothetical protein U5N86_05940 [Planctomycetota bacterium]|nr:hypothetical protein [Planctomycetota bacterium]